MATKRIREKPHRLPEAAYCGKVVEVFVRCLFEAAADNRTEVAIYCFMPDHLHTILKGVDHLSRPKRAMNAFKYATDQWLAANQPDFEWQEDYHDHIIRNGEDGDKHVVYIACNPVRAGLVESPLDYPSTGSSAADWRELLVTST
ncbi:MAG TPA: transposase [Fimbriimonadaceae bacterium]|nr:transposase [Fimbriimonadaceae bacterium]